jgi:hypothetical protein
MEASEYKGSSAGPTMENIQLLVTQTNQCSQWGILQRKEERKGKIYNRNPTTRS